MLDTQGEQGVHRPFWDASETGSVLSRITLWTVIYWLLGGYAGTGQTSPMVQFNKPLTQPPPRPKMWHTGPICDTRPICDTHPANFGDKQGLKKIPVWSSRVSKFCFFGKELLNLTCPRVQSVSHLVTESLAKVRKQWTVRAACPKDKLEFKLFSSPEKCPKTKVVVKRTLAWYSKTRRAYDN